MLKRAIPKPTPDQQRRQDLCRDHGCLACRLEGYHAFACGPVEIHHMTEAGRTMGQDYTIALGAWHHRAEPRDLLRKSQMREVYGPSLAEGSKRFHARYGDNATLLAAQNDLIGWTAEPQVQRKRKGNTASPAKCLPRTA